MRRAHSHLLLFLCDSHLILCTPQRLLWLLVIKTYFTLNVSIWWGNSTTQDDISGYIVAHNQNLLSFLFFLLFRCAKWLKQEQHQKKRSRRQKEKKVVHEMRHAFGKFAMHLLIIHRLTVSSWFCCWIRRQKQEMKEEGGKKTFASRKSFFQWLQQRFGVHFEKRKEVRLISKYFSSFLQPDADAEAVTAKIPLSLHPLQHLLFPFRFSSTSIREKEREDRKSMKKSTWPADLIALPFHTLLLSLFPTNGRRDRNVVTSSCIMRFISSISPFDCCCSSSLHHISLCTDCNSLIQSAVC